MTALVCRNERRREQVRQHETLNGLDYLEVGEPDQSTPSLASQRKLRVYFLGKRPVTIAAENVRIEGGRRNRDIQVVRVEVHSYESPDLDDFMEVEVDKAGDFSTYTLTVVEASTTTDSNGVTTTVWRPHSEFDPHYNRLDFSFKVDCPSDLDCKEELICPPEVLPEPDINYLAKDYASFRQLILDRLALIMPDWRERHIPDIGIALVEVLAYVGDHLSYYQDAVATEAYLDTARKRVSVRRHARLVDYHMHEGCNARAWLCIGVDNDQTTVLPEEVYFITGINHTLQILKNVVREENLQQIPSSRYEVFEPMGKNPIRLYQDHNIIRFYSWGNKECCLPIGATGATLVGELIPDDPGDNDPCDPPAEPAPDPGDVPPDDPGNVPPDVPGNTPIDDDSNYPPDDSDVDVPVTPPEDSPGDTDDTLPPVNDVAPTPQLHLKAGDVLIIEEVLGPETGHKEDANPKHRHAVCLTSVEPGFDPLNNQPLVRVTWADEDALPFALCLSSLGPAPECACLVDVSVACGNVMLVDHGRSVDEDLGEVPTEEVPACCKAEGVVADQKQISGWYRPRLTDGPLTFCEPLPICVSATKTLTQDVRRALPHAILDGHSDQDGDSTWMPVHDLLACGPDDQHFVAEMDDERVAQIRFGDDESGERPDAAMHFHARYRVGNGLPGNVGAESISHIVIKPGQAIGGALSVRNPMPAIGGTAPESTADVKLFAPVAFRNILQRAITADDYAAIVEREFSDVIQRAAAQLRWTGSWYEMLVAVDPYGAEEADADLLQEVSARLHRFRRMGHDLVVKAARRVALDIELLVCVQPHYLRAQIKAELMGLLGRQILPDGEIGFFHPDNLSFGTDIYVSHLVAIVQAVEGVESVQVQKLQRLFERPNNELESGVLALGPFEIAQLNNDPSFPEHGRLVLDLRGGR